MNIPRHAPYGVSSESVDSMLSLIERHAQRMLLAPVSGISSVERTRRLLKPSERAKVLREHAKGGKTHAQIAALCGCGASTVSRILAESRRAA